MVSAIGGIGSYAASLYTFQTQSNSTVQESAGFDETLTNKISNDYSGNGYSISMGEVTNTNSVPDGKGGAITTSWTEPSDTSDSNSTKMSPGAAKGADNTNSKTDSEMDLNHDGVVSIDEVMQYVAMQMAQNMEEELAQEGSEQSGKNIGQDLGQKKFDMDTFKNMMATKAYQMGENLMDTSISAVTKSFAL